MWFKKHWFWLVLVAIVVSWMGNTFYYESRQLEKPIFLRHYIEQTFEETTFLTLYYIANKKDYTDIQMVTIDGITVYPQADTSFFTGDRTKQSFHQEFNHHYLKQTVLEIPKDLLSENQVKEGIDVEEIDVVFSQSPSMKFSIGNIRLMPREETDNLLSQISNSGSSDGIHQSVSQAKEPLQMDEFIFPFKNTLTNDISISFYVSEQQHAVDSKNGNFSFAKNTVVLEKDEYLHTNIKLKNSTNKVINLQMKWTGKTKTGKKLHTYLFANNYPYLTQSDVNAYVLEERGGN